MPRYIDADALISKIAFHRDSLKPYNVVAVSAFDAVIDFIKRRPTVSPDDVRGVVHCKECKHTERDGTDDPAIYCKVWDRWEMPEDGFCYKGAKMEVTSDA